MSTEILILSPVSGNPQTFNQALLLMANLARLAPASVLYNVMPVFTFMGSNVFHRDDTYSFKVVQQVYVYHIQIGSSDLGSRQSMGLYLSWRRL